MTAYNVPHVAHLAGAVEAKGFGPVPIGEEWMVDVRVCATGGVDSVVDLKIQMTNGTNAGLRHKGFAVPNGSGSFDLEKSLPMTAGAELWDRSGNGDVMVTYTATRRSVA